MTFNLEMFKTKEKTSQLHTSDLILSFPPQSEKNREEGAAFQLLQEVIKSSHQKTEVSFEWLTNTDLKVKGLSPLILHKYTLLVEKTGKQVNYNKVLRVLIGA